MRNGIISLIVLMVGSLLCSQGADAAVGRTQGSFNVSPTGAATYQIPIWVPPGTKGMQPNLAITYNSQTSDGTMGPGWSIAGLSAISRCNKTFADDAAPSSVKLNIADGYCLNGNRLRLTSASGSYGAEGSTYQTELADFSQVIAHGTAADGTILDSGPTWFEVWSKDGLIYQYGNTPDSRITGGSTAAYQWLLNKVRDRAGNNYVVTYGTGAAGSVGIGVPLTMSWTPSSYNATTYNYLINFAYSDTTTSGAGPKVSYVNGVLVRNTNRLDSITVKYGSNTVRKYALGYQVSPTTAHYRLQTVTECTDDAATDCLSPTAMTYQNGQAGVTTMTSMFGATADPQTIQFADINGDGRQDIVYKEPGGAPYYFNVVVQLAQASGFSAPIDTHITNHYITSPVLLDDFDGDGKVELLYGAGATWTVHRWNGSDFVASSVNVGVDAARVNSTFGGDFANVDVNGDGLPDLLSLLSDGRIYQRLNTSGGGVVSFSTSQTVAFDIGAAIPGNWGLGYSRLRGNNDFQWSRSKLKHLDFNGDGREDFVLQLAASAIATPTSYQVLSTEGTFTRGADLPNGAVPFDRNDDGCTDMYGATPATCDGNLASEDAGSYGGVLYNSYGPVPIDWDGDGRTDLLGFADAAYTQPGVQLSTGDGYSSTIPIDGFSLPAVPAGYIFPFDQNGDGLDDLAYANIFDCIHDGQYACPLYFGLHNGSSTPPDLISSIVDGYGVSYSPSYVTITQSNYIKGTNTAYPELDVTGSVYVVSQIAASDGIGGTYTQTYTYTGARKNLQGRGFAGFESMRVVDNRLGGLIRKTTFMNGQTASIGCLTSTTKLGFPCTGMVYQDDVYQSDGTLISHTVNTPAVVTLDSTTNNQRYFPYIATTTNQTYEVGGIKNGQLIAITSKSFTYDNYGNATYVVATVTDKDSGSPYLNQSWTTSIENSFSPNDSTWCVRFPWQSIVSNSASNGELGTSQRTLYSNNYSKCRVTGQVVLPGTHYQVNTDYVYDDDVGNPQPDFGNLTSVAVTGYAMAARTTSIEWTTASRSTGQFPMKVINAEGHVTQMDYDFDKGLVSSQIDPNNATTSWQYDNFGRKSLETRPDNTSTLRTYSFYAAAPITEYLQITEEIRDASSAVTRTNTSRFDIFERPTVQVQQLVAGNASATIRAYNARGQVQYDYFPYDTAGGNNGYSIFTYDALNRVTQVQRPISANNNTLQTTSYQYLGRTIVTTDAEGKQTTKITDINGRLRRSQDHNGYYQSFVYDAIGSLKSVTDSQSNTLFSATYLYGAQAFQTSTFDMDLGSWGYTPNALGEVGAYTDNKGVSFTASFDKLSRPLTRTEPDNSTIWTWGTNPALHEMGQLRSLSSTTGTTESYSYDGIGRLSQRDITVDGTTYSYNSTYNSAGQQDTFTYPTSTSGYRLSLKYFYQYGLLRQIKDNNASTIFWQANAMNPRGQVTQEQLGNGLVANKTYDAITGLISSLQCGIGGGACSQNQSYLWDKVGNLTQRQNNNLGLTENFYYDNVHRLDYSQLNGVTNLDMTYDDAGMGNIKSRSDVANNATWIYDSAHKHQVLQAGSGNTYSYDPNGNVTARNGNSITWTSYNYPSQITGSGETISLYYDANRQRYKQLYAGNGVNETTLYIGGLMQKVSANSADDYRYTITANGQTIAIMSRGSSGINATRYMLNDYQGSVAKFTDSSGNSILSESFTAFGARRNPQTWSGPATYGDQITISGIAREGYTGHTALGMLGLNHMNGRVQDAITGRFLSADPYITEPGNTQNYNRYSYVYNNPMSHIDPSGFCRGENDASAVADTWCDGNYSGGGSQGDIGTVGNGSPVSGPGVSGPGYYHQMTYRSILSGQPVTVVGSWMYWSPSQTTNPGWFAPSSTTLSLSGPSLAPMGPSGDPSGLDEDTGPAFSVVNGFAGFTATLTQSVATNLSKASASFKTVQIRKHYRQVSKDLAIIGPGLGRFGVYMDIYSMVNADNRRDFYTNLAAVGIDFALLFGTGPVGLGLAAIDLTLSVTGVRDEFLDATYDAVFE